MTASLLQRLISAWVLEIKKANLLESGGKKPPLF